MNAAKRLGLVAVLVIGLGLLGSRTAWAKPTTWVLELTNVGDEPQASGVASFTVKKVTWRAGGYGLWVREYWGKLTVSCVNLTPGATYSTPAGTFTADATGAGSATKQTTLGVGLYEGGGIPDHIYVDRLNPGALGTRVLFCEFWGEY